MTEIIFHPIFAAEKIQRHFLKLMFNIKISASMKKNLLTLAVAGMTLSASAQEKGIDLLLYRYDNGGNKANTIQVKMSRTYYNDKEDSGYPFYLWFNRFPVQQNANWYILVGIYAKHSDDVKNAGAKSTKWDTIMLAFTNKEMLQFMSEVKQRRDPTKDDKMFGFGFDSSKAIFQTRGCPENRDMSRYLIEKRIDEITHSFI